MNIRHRPLRTLIGRAALAGIASGLLAVAPGIGLAQSGSFQIPAGDPPHSTADLETLVGPIALYPDDLIGIVLPASTYPLQVVQAARFLDRRAADASLEPDPEWDNAVVALLNYPEVLALMDDNLDWTWALGEAVLAQQADVIDAIQRFRTLAYTSGNLRSDERQVVTRNDDVIEIAPADPEVIYIPYYEPARVVVAQPRPVYYYYPDPYPVYYYPYPVGYDFGYRFGYGFFWGVTSIFNIGWHTHFVNVYDHGYYLHPYYGRTYYAPYYARRGVNINVLYRGGHIWRPTEHRAARPHVGRGRTVTSSEGYVADRARPTSGGRTTISREQPGIARDASGINRKTLPEQRRAAVTSRVESTTRRAAPAQSEVRGAQPGAGTGTGTSARTRVSPTTTPSTRSVGRPAAKDASSAPLRTQAPTRTTRGSILTRESTTAPTGGRIVAPADTATRSVAPQAQVRGVPPTTQLRTRAPQVRTVAPAQPRASAPLGVADSAARAGQPRMRVEPPSRSSSGSRPQTFSAPAPSAPRAGRSQGSSRAGSARSGPGRRPN